MSLTPSAVTFPSPRITLTCPWGLWELAGGTWSPLRCAPSKGPGEGLPTSFGEGCLIRVSVFEQNLLGLQNVPRQFFLQVYHTFHHVGETRYLLALFCPPQGGASFRPRRQALHHLGPRCPCSTAPAASLGSWLGSQAPRWTQTC